MQPHSPAGGAVVGGATGRLPGLTGLRGVAALWVVAFHLHPGSRNPLFGQGWMGVDIFFVLSGFVLGHVYLDRMRPGDAGAYRAFLRNRVARIFPLHVAVMLVLGLLVLGASHGAPAAPGWDLTTFLSTLLLVQNWPGLPTGVWNLPAWSLSAEWMAYLLFPAFLWLAVRVRGRAMALLLAGLLLGLFAAAVMLAGRPDGDVPDKALRTLRMGCEFAAGLLLLRARAAGLMLVPPLLELAGLALLLPALAGGWAGLLALPGFALLVLAAADPASRTGRALAMRPLLFLGEISYSLYLVHAVIFSLPRLAWWQALGGAWWAGAAHDLSLVALCLVVAWGTYLAIERPARTWARRAG